MEVVLEHAQRLHFDDGSPVRAASAVTRLGEGLLVVQDDATHAAWWRADTLEQVRLFAPVEGHEVFDDGTGTKELKPDLEAACAVEVGGVPAVLLLGSGSSPRRTRSALVRLYDGRPDVVAAELAPLYWIVAEVLGVRAADLNLEGACVVGDVVRWFHRGLPSAGSPSASVDLALPALLAAAGGRGSAASVAVGGRRAYDLGEVGGVGLAVTDAVTLPSGELLLSAAAEDAPNPRDDGPVVGAALVRLADDDVAGSAALPELEGGVCKVEGLTLLAAGAGEATLLGVVDADDPTAASWAVRLRVSW